MRRNGFDEGRQPDAIGLMNRADQISQSDILYDLDDVLDLLENDENPISNVRREVRLALANEMSGHHSDMFNVNDLIIASSHIDFRDDEFESVLDAIETRLRGNTPASQN